MAYEWDEITANARCQSCGISVSVAMRRLFFQTMQFLRSLRSGLIPGPNRIVLQRKNGKWFCANLIHLIEKND
jgi:hypothetical protein